MYDGVHRGHQTLIGAAVARARAMGRPCLLLTFDPHPAEVDPAGLAPGDPHLDGPQGRAGRRPRRRRDVRAAVHRRSSCGCRRRPSPTRCWSSSCTPRRSWWGRTSPTATARPARSRRWPSRDAGSASPSRACRWPRTPPTARRHHLVDLHPGLRRRPATWCRRPAPWGGRTGSTASSSAATAGAGRWATRRRTSRARAFTAIPADGVYAGHLVTRDPRSGASRDRFPAAISVGQQPDVPGQPAHRRGVRARLRRRPLRRARRASSSCSGCARWPRSPTSTACSRPWPRTSPTPAQILGM